MSSSSTLIMMITMVSLILISSSVITGQQPYITSMQHNIDLPDIFALVTSNINLTLGSAVDAGALKNISDIIKAQLSAIDKAMKDLNVTLQYNDTKYLGLLELIDEIANFTIELNQTQTRYNDLLVQLNSSKVQLDFIQDRLQCFNRTTCYSNAPTTTPRPAAPCYPVLGPTISADSTQQNYENPSNTYRYDCSYTISVRPGLIATLPYLRLRANVTITGANAWFAINYVNGNNIFNITRTSYGADNNGNWTIANSSSVQWSVYCGADSTILYRFVFQAWTNATNFVETESTGEHRIEQSAAIHHNFGYLDEPLMMAVGGDDDDRVKRDDVMK